MCAHLGADKKAVGAVKENASRSGQESCRSVKENVLASTSCQGRYVESRRCQYTLVHHFRDNAVELVR